LGRRPTVITKKVTNVVKSWINRISVRSMRVIAKDLKVSEWTIWNIAKTSWGLGLWPEPADFSSQNVSSLLDWSVVRNFFGFRRKIRPTSSSQMRSSSPSTNDLEQP
jgi:hypothetical protein